MMWICISAVSSPRRPRRRVGETTLRLDPILLPRRAALPAETDDAYLRKVIAAGSFQNYERAHLNAIAATFAPKLPLPPSWSAAGARPPRRRARKFHVGYY